MLKFLKGRHSLITWDGVLIAPAVLILLIGFIGLYSTSLSTPFFSSSLFRQAVWVILAVIAVWLLRWVHPKFFYKHAYRLYGLLLLMLLATYFMPAFSGGQRWIALGSFRMQPSEIGKILVVLALARYLTDYQKHLDKFLYSLVPLGIALLPALFIMGQPDLGTAIVYLVVAMMMMSWAGVQTFHLFVMIAPLTSIITGFNYYSFTIWMLVVGLVLYFWKPGLRWGVTIFTGNVLFGILAPKLWSVIPLYQQRRVLSFLDASSDPHGAGYQVLQARTAIGSGGVFGKGIGEGTQTHLRFLPARDTDFIIAVVGEELGFLAILTVLILFGWLLLRMVDRASTTQYQFASTAIIGFATILLVHVFVNMAMATGLMPVTGLPLPFMSYGGSFLLTCALIIGLTNLLLAGET